MKSRLLGLCVVVGLLGTANVAKAVPFDDLNIGDVVKVETLLSPKAYRVTEQGPFVPPDVQADFVVYCINAGAPIGDTFFVVTGFTSNIDPRTAYLYSRYRDGLIPPGYDTPLPPPPGTGLAPKRPDGLQEAIWFIQGQSGGIFNSLVAQADCAVFGLTDSGQPQCAGATWFLGIGSIRSLELKFQANNQPAQSLLVSVSPDNPDCRFDPRCNITTVPEPSSLALFGSGLVAVATALRRRFRPRA